MNSSGKTRASNFGSGLAWPSSKPSTMIFSLARGLINHCYPDETISYQCNRLRSNAAWWYGLKMECISGLAKSPKSSLHSLFDLILSTTASVLVERCDDRMYGKTKKIALRCWCTPIISLFSHILFGIAARESLSHGATWNITDETFKLGGNYSESREGDFSTLFDPCCCDAMFCNLLMIPAPKGPHPLAKHYQLVTKTNFSQTIFRVPIRGALEYPALKHPRPSD